MKHLSLFKTHNFTITLKKSSDKFYIRPFGDVHRDAPSCDVERWKWFLKKSKEDPNAENTYYIGMGDYCLPLSTEILTKNGWKHHNELTIGDIVCAYDNAADRLKWTPLRGVYYSPNQETYRLKSKSFDFVCTNNHGWFVSHQGDPNTEKKPLSALRSHHRIRVVAEVEDSATFPYLSVTPEECYLLGWIVTDGNIKHRGAGINVSVSQSAKKFLSKLKDAFSGKYTASYTNTKNDCETLNIKTSVARDLFHKFGFKSKDDLPEIVTHLNKECRKSMLLAFHEAEGWKERDRWNFAQLEGGVLEAYRILATLAGIRIGVSHKRADGVVTHKESDRRNVTFDDLKITTEDNQLVWCPMTDFSSIVARQGTTITITGNCDFASAKEGKTLKNAGLHETTMENIDYAAQRRSRLIAKEINHMKGRIIGLLGGNHTWIIDGKTLDEDLAERMGCAYLGYLAIIKLTIRFADRGLRKHYNVYLFVCHGLGGGRVLGSSIRKVEELFYIFPSADLYIMGHDHNRGAIPAPRLKPIERRDGTLGLKQQRQFFIRSGSFQKSYTPDTGGFATGRLMRPADLGTVCIIGSFHRDQRNDGDDTILDLEVLI